MTTASKLALVLAIAACGKSKPNLYDLLVQENEAALKKRLANLRTAIAEAKKRPPLTPPKLREGGFIGLEETTNLEESGYQGQPGCHLSYDGEVYALMAGKGVRQEDPYAIEARIREGFKAALAPPYAAVCVQLASEAPGRGPDNTFTGGTYKGECRIFDLASGAYLGGVAISSKMTSALVNARNGAGLDESMGRTVTSDLETALGVKPPMMHCSWPSK